MYEGQFLYIVRHVNLQTVMSTNSLFFWLQVKWRYQSGTLLTAKPEKLKLVCYISMTAYYN